MRIHLRVCVGACVECGHVAVVKLPFYANHYSAGPR